MAETETELPECPVCLQPFNDDAIPRVLPCGHSTCESCLKQLPQPFPNTLRCPACTQLIKLPSHGGLSALPKNIDLLRFTQQQQQLNPQIQQSVSSDPPRNDPSRFMRRMWSDEFEQAWKGWILPEDSILVDSSDLGFGTGRMVEEGRKVSLVGVCVVASCEKDYVFELTYFAKVMVALREMDDVMRDELRLVMKVCSRRSCLVNELYGFWYCEEDGLVYLVCERKCGDLMERIREIEYCTAGRNFGFGVMGMELCEAVIGLGLGGVVLGCLGIGCLGFDEFGHLCVDLSGVLMCGRGVYRKVADSVDGKEQIKESDMVSVYFKLLKDGFFIAPEVFLDLMGGESVIMEYDGSRFSIGHASDVWSLACMLINIILGKDTKENVTNGHDAFQPDGDLDYLGSYTAWSEKIKSLLENALGAEQVVLCQILCKCIDLNPDSRPLASDVWKSIKYFVSEVLVDGDKSFEESNGEQFGCCVALGKLCQLPKKTADNHENTNSKDESEAVMKSVTKIPQGIVDGVSCGDFKVAHMKGHLDSITGLAVGGNFLFSSSFDKTINVWSLKDFTLVHTFRGHEHRVAALICLEKEQPFCISGDSGGGIFIWDISNPFDHEPLRKWYEEKDWRYSGIHSLAVHGDKYLYTGSGDKTIKMWSLKDFSLSCTLTGHTSVVSCLAISHGVLYSGSWDGTVRLWSLNDHSLLTILGEDMLESRSSVLAMSVFDDVFAVSQENGCVKIWKNDELKRSLLVHKGAVFAVCLDGKCLFSGGWDKVVHVQEISDESAHTEVRSLGFLSPESVITSLLWWQGMLLVGCADRLIQAYYWSGQGQSLSS